MRPRYRPGDAIFGSREIVFNRRVMLTTLDPIPRPFRACPGVIVMNQPELDAFNRGERETVGMIIDICRAEDAAETRQVFKYAKRRKRHDHSRLEDRI